MVVQKKEAEKPEADLRARDIIRARQDVFVGDTSVQVQVKVRGGGGERVYAPRSKQPNDLGGTGVTDSLSGRCVNTERLLALVLYP